jgi:tricarballylate dehydrogenase
MGGIPTNIQAEVVRDNQPVVKGLYAAGEVTGHFYRQAPNSVAMLRALVFGKIAGEHAVFDVRQSAGG